MSETRATRLPWSIAADARILEIETGRLVSLGRGEGGRVIQCLSGIAWVTQENDARDHILGAGEELLIQSPGLVVVQALRSARLIVLPIRRRWTRVG